MHIWRIDGNRIYSVLFNFFHNNVMGMDSDISALNRGLDEVDQQ